ncbi:hypothetical protein BC835DRAFT_1365776 [Cytidiella melzeri]|nr:hypothetical protein BC835DRAFT_1365776 [Cytidiella melzeri]
MAQGPPPELFRALPLPLADKTASTFPLASILPPTISRGGPSEGTFGPSISQNPQTMSSWSKAVTNLLLLCIPSVLDDLLAPALGLQASNAVTSLAEVLGGLRDLFSAYYAICVYHIVISGAIAHSVLRALAKQDPSMTLTRTNCAPLSYTAGVMSILLGLASVTLSFCYASHFRLLSLSNLSLRIWMQNARRNAKHPWKNVPALLAAPSALCIWSVILFMLHLISWDQCQSVIEYDPEQVLLRAHSFQPRTLKAAVAVCGFLLWTYTVRAMRAFAQLNDPSPLLLGRA